MNENGALILKNIKECVDFFRVSSSRCIGEDNKGLVLLLIRLEDLFRRGLRKKKGSDYYDYFAACLKKDMDFGCHFKKVEAFQELKTNTGRGRVLLRFLVSLNVLGNFLELCLCAKATATWYASNAYLRQQIFVDKFLTLLNEISAYQFDIEFRVKEIDFMWPFEENLTKHDGEYYLTSINAVGSSEVTNSENTVQQIFGLSESDDKDLKISALEAKINVLETSCRMLLEQVEEKNESKKNQGLSDVDNLRQISLFARSSPDGSYNLSNVSLEDAQSDSCSTEANKSKHHELAEVVIGSDWFNDEQREKFDSIYQTLRSCDTRYSSIENNILLLLEKIPQIEGKLQSSTAMSPSSSDLLEELMEQQRILSDEIASHALLETTMLDDKKELELRIQSLTSELDEAKRISTGSKNSVACQTHQQTVTVNENLQGIEASSTSTHEVESEYNSQSSLEEVSVSSKLGTEFERLAHKYSDALKKIAELQELNEIRQSSGKSSAAQEKVMQLKSEVNDLKNQIASVTAKLELEEKQRELLASENRSQANRISDLENTAKQLDEYHLSAVQDKSNLEAEVNCLKKELEAARREKLQLQVEKSAITLECAQMHDQLNKPAEDSLKLEELRRETEIREQELKEEIQSLKDNLNCTIASSKSQVDAITAERNSIQKMYVDVKRQLFIQEKYFKDAMDEQESNSKLMTDRILSLTKEKDNLWQKLDRVQEISQPTLISAWEDDTGVKNCSSCDVLFSLFIRKHHCRSCGKIFCVNCCSNFIPVPHSSKKERVCVVCFNNRKDAKKLLGQQMMSSPNLGGTEREQFENSVRESKGKFDARRTRGHKGSVSSLFLSHDENRPSPMRSNTVNVPHMTRSSTTNNLTEDSNSSSGMVWSGGTSDDPNYSNSDLEHREVNNRRASISNSIVNRLDFDDPTNRTKSPSISDPNNAFQGLMTCPLEEVISEMGRREGEIVLSPYESRGFPMEVQPGATISWHFSSKPKSIQFCLLFRSFRQNQGLTSTSELNNTETDETSGQGTDTVEKQSSDDLPEPNGSDIAKEDIDSFDDVHVIIPLITCKSHREEVRGEVLVKTAGIYTIYFDNSKSEYTSKNISYYISVS